MNNPMPEMTSENKGGAGTMIAAVVVIVVILIGALYFWNARSAQAPALDETASTVQAITDVSTSDEATDIQTDLNSTELDNLDAQLNAI